MPGCEGALQSLLDGIAQAENLKNDRDEAEREMNERLDAFRSSALSMGRACLTAAITKSPVSALNCEARAAEASLDLLLAEAAMADFALKNHLFNNQVAENHDRFNRFCYCLSLGVEAVEYGNEFDALEEQLEELLDEVDDATDPDEIEDIEEEIEEVLEDLEFYDELLEEIREEVEREFGP